MSSTSSGLRAILLGAPGAGTSKRQQARLCVEVAHRVSLFALAACVPGKGTMAKRLIQDFGFKHISSGDALRQQIQSGTDLGNQASDFIKVSDRMSCLACGGASSTDWFLSPPYFRRRENWCQTI